MPIYKFEGQPAVARLSSIRFDEPLKDVAARLARWQAETGGHLAPVRIEFDREAEEGLRRTGRQFYQERARLVRTRIAQDLGLDDSAARKLTFSVTPREAWYLGRTPNLDTAGMVAAAASSPAMFIELMLTKHLIEAGVRDAEDMLVSGGFGPSVYLGSASQATKRRVNLAEVDFKVNTKFNYLLCGLTAKSFLRKKDAQDRPSLTKELVAVGGGHMVEVARLVADDFVSLDAREQPLVGVTFDRRKFRQTRLYYLNIILEFALDLFAKAEVRASRDTFYATHWVDQGFIPLAPVASLQQPIKVVNASGLPMTAEAIKPLERLAEFFPDGYHVAGTKKIHFQPPIVSTAETVPEALEAGTSYLFLNGESQGEDGTIRVAKLHAGGELRATSASAAYAGLARGDCIADPYTTLKYRHLMEAEDISVTMQGIDCSPAALAAMMPGRINKSDRPLQEALKRCLVELSLKEALRKVKAIPIPGMPEELLPGSFTLLATRQIRMDGKVPPKQLISVVDVTLDARGVTIDRVLRSPWSKAEATAIDRVMEYPFLQPPNSKSIRNNQFWIIDRATGYRLTAYSGKALVPYVVLNDAYENVESALRAQAEHLTGRGETGKGNFYSKSQKFNVLPYYISMFEAGQAPRNERNGTRIAVQDRGGFVRVFVPPAGGITGGGDALSGMRDLMLYDRGGAQVNAGLLDNALVKLYLHTMTNGILVGGDNSKMSILEKMARLALEN